MGEGRYQMSGSLTLTTTTTGLDVTIKLSTLHSVRESGWDRGTTSDEPFLLAVFSSPGANERHAARTEPFEDVDRGETRNLGIEPRTIKVPRYGGLIIALQAWESDSESATDRDRLLETFLSGYDQSSVNQRSQFIDAIGRAAGPDWKLGAVDAFAFRRDEPVTTIYMVRDRKIDRWVEAGSSLAIELSSDSARRTGGCTRATGEILGEGGRRPPPPARGPASRW